MFQLLPTVCVHCELVSAQLALTVFNDSDCNERVDVWTKQVELMPGQFLLIMNQVVGKKKKIILHK